MSIYLFVGHLFHNYLSLHVCLCFEISLFWYILICFWTFVFFVLVLECFSLCCSHFTYLFFETLFGLIIVFLTFFIFSCYIFFHTKTCFCIVSVCTVSFFLKKKNPVFLVCWPFQKWVLVLCVFSFFFLFLTFFFWTLLFFFSKQKLCRKNFMCSCLSVSFQFFFHLFFVSFFGCFLLDLLRNMFPFKKWLV